MHTSLLALLLWPAAAIASDAPSAHGEKEHPIPAEARASLEQAAKAGKPSRPKPPDPGHAQPAAAHGDGAKPELVWRSLLDGNERFVQGKVRSRELVNVRRELAKGQHPKAIVLTCSDSRLSPELLFDQSLGDLFVVRTAGNVADPIALASMEYAVEHLHSKLLVVLGHESCGAVAAAASGEKMPTANLTALVKKIQPALESLKTCPAGEHVGLLRVESNVHQSAKDLAANSPIIREHLEKGELKIVKGVYYLATGQVEEL